MQAPPPTPTRASADRAVPMDEVAWRVCADNAITQELLSGCFDLSQACAERVLHATLATLFAHNDDYADCLWVYMRETVGDQCMVQWLLDGHTRLHAAQARMACDGSAVCVCGARRVACKCSGFTASSTNVYCRERRVWTAPQRVRPHGDACGVDHAEYGALCQQLRVI